MYNLKEFKDVFDPILQNFLNKRLRQFSNQTSDSFIKDFVIYSDKLAISGGKRIRPYVAYVMYCAMGGKDIKNALRLFVSLEIFHTFALIHDDIMDKANTRHGVQTLPTYVLGKLNEQKRVGDLNNVANAQGILTGDLFFSWAMEIFLDNKSFASDNIKKAHEYFYKMVDEVVLGQMIDIDITTRENAYEELIEEKARLKTSKYTFVRPMQIGAGIANSNHTADTFCEELGTKLGIAFQLQDDLLDIIGDSKILEKNILRDIADRQHTFFTNYVLKNGRKEQKTKLLNYFGKNIKESEQDEIVKIFIDSGALAAGNKIIEQNLEEAKKIVNNSSLKEQYKNIFSDFIKTMEQRQS